METSNANAEQKPELWLVHFMSSWYDNDPRGSGDVPVDEYIYVVASGYDDAIEKAQPELRKLKKKYKEHKLDVKPMPIQLLVPARDGKNDGRLGFYSTVPLKPVALTLASDRKKYRLAVCLIPIES